MTTSALLSAARKVDFQILSRTKCLRYTASVRSKLTTMAAVLICLSCGQDVTQLCTNAVQAFENCGGSAPASNAIGTCLARYKASTAACQQAFQARIDCTRGFSCSEQTLLCADALAAEEVNCNNDPIVPPM